MKNFSFPGRNSTLLLLRISIAIIFLAHAIVRITGGTIDRFAGFLTDKGFPLSIYIVWLLTVFEITGGILLALGYFVKGIAAGLILVLLTGIIVIHAAQGWFVGEHGAGGMEYSFILIIALLVTASHNPITINKNKMT